MEFECREKCEHCSGRGKVQTGPRAHSECGYCGGRGWHYTEKMDQIAYEVNHLLTRDAYRYPEGKDSKMYHGIIYELEKRIHALEEGDT